MPDSRIAAYQRAISRMIRGEFPVRVSVQRSNDEVAKLGLALLELGSALEARFDELQGLSQITDRINAGLLLDDVLDHVYDAFRDIIPYDRIGCALLSKDGATVRAHWARSEATEIKLKAGFTARMDGSSLQQIIDTGEPRILNDLVAYLKEHPNSVSTRLVVEEGVRSSLTCPLVASGRPIGFLFFSSTAPDTYKDAHVELYERVAGQLSVIVQKSDMYQRLLELSEQKDRFLGMAAHDLRNPLGVVRGYLSLIESGTLGPVEEAQAAVLKRMDRACSTMLRLLEDLLDVATIESGQVKLNLKRTEVSTYLGDFHAAYAMLAEAKALRVELQVEDALPPVNVDRERLDQALANLFTNALKFSQSKTTVTIGANLDGDEVALWIRDQGQGIAESEQAQLFTAFGRTSTKPTAGEKSTGLGLMIVKRVAELHGGRAFVRSKLGKGSCFTIALPLATDD